MKPIKTLNKMKKLILVLAMAFVSVMSFSQNPQYVSGYYKSNGTYVKGYYRTEANNTVIDNWSTKGNVNPYTGEIGTKNITDYNSIHSNYSNNYSIPTNSYQINNIIQTNPINYTNDLMKTNSINYTNDLFKTNSLFR